jgi:hypothetical protein
MPPGPRGPLAFRFRRVLIRIHRVTGEAARGVGEAGGRILGAGDRNERPGLLREVKEIVERVVVRTRAGVLGAEIVIVKRRTDLAQRFSLLAEGIFREIENAGEVVIRRPGVPQLGATQKPRLTAGLRFSLATDRWPDP